MTEVVVVGSLNLDLSLRVDRFPEPGETVTGSMLARGGGGKGANQAVGAARLGRTVAMVGAVGDDDPGRRLTADLGAAGVDVSSVMVHPDQPTGTAIIEVDRSGENRIVVVPGANGSLDAAAVTAAGPMLTTSSVVLTQFETPVTLIERVAEIAPTATVVVNPAPAVVDVGSGSMLGSVDYLIPNRHELAALDDGRPATGENEIAAQARRVLARSDRLRAVIVTLGSDGVIVCGIDRSVQIPAVGVDVVDTTAAGDAFCAGFADGLLNDPDDVEGAARWATRVAAVAVTRPGAQSALPTREDVLKLDA